MMILRACAPVIFLLAPAPGQETGAGTFKVEVAGLHINKAPYKGDKDLARKMEPNPGTQVSVLILLDEGGIIELDHRKSKIVKFADDKGADLLAAKAPEDSFHSTPIHNFPDISEDQKAILIDLQAFTAPTSGARTLHVEGTISLNIGQDPEKAKPVKVEARQGAAFKAGGIDFKIKEAGKTDFGKEPMHISLESKEGLKVATFRFFDAAGKEIEYSGGSRGYMRMGDDATYSWDFKLKKLVSAVAVEVTVWKKVTRVGVPVKLAVSVGL